MNHDADTKRNPTEEAGCKQKDKAYEKQKTVAFLLLAALLLLGGLWIGYDRGRYHPPEPPYSAYEGDECGYIQEVEALANGDTLLHLRRLGSSQLPDMGGGEVTLRLLPDTQVMVQHYVDLHAIGADQLVRVTYWAYSETKACRSVSIWFLSGGEDEGP